jgi:hypothetical protein
MDVNKVGQGKRIAGIAGALLFIDLWMSWFGVNLDKLGDAAKYLTNVDTTATAWQAFSLIDIIIAVTALVALAAFVMAATDTRVELPFSLTSAAAGLGALSTLLILYRIIDNPGDAPNSQITVEWGCWIGLLLAAALTYGAWRAVGEETTTTPTAAAPPPPPPAAEPPAAPTA